MSEMDLLTIYSPSTQIYIVSIKCIDKNRLLTIEVYIDGNEIYTVHGYSDITYTIGKDGIIKMNRDEHFFERVYENVMQSINPLNYL